MSLHGEPRRSEVTIPKERLDALTDGVFAFAMTLLVVNVDLPDDLAPKTQSELIYALLDLGDTITAYVVTFLVLGIFWLNRAGARGSTGEASGAYCWAVLAHLFFVTLMPFSMLVLGQFDFAPAVWLYSGNMIILAVTAAAIAATVDAHRGARPRESGYIATTMLVVSAVLAMVIATSSPDQAMLAYLLNLATPLVRRLLAKLAL